jgi:hypothetical protein
LQEAAGFVSGDAQHGAIVENSCWHGAGLPEK